MKVKAYLYQLIACLYENDSFLNADNIEENDTYKIENVKKSSYFYSAQLQPENFTK